MIYTYEQLLAKAKRRLNQGLLVKTQDQYQLDHGELDRWREAYTQLCKDEDVIAATLASIFAECATYVSFLDFLEYLLDAYDDFLRKNDNKPYVFVYQKETKSDFWIAELLVYHLPDGALPPSYITNNFTQLTKVIDIDKVTIVACDDACYSGEQMCDTIRDITRCYENDEPRIVNVAVLVAAMTSMAQKRIYSIFKECTHDQNDKQISVFYRLPLLTIPRMLVEKFQEEDVTKTKQALLKRWINLIQNQDFINKSLMTYFSDFPKSNMATYSDSEFDLRVYNIHINVPYYFEHKLPDGASSFPSLFAGYVTQRCGSHQNGPFKIIANCKLSEKSLKTFAVDGSSVHDECAQPFYKIEVRNDGSHRGGEKLGQKHKKKPKSKVLYML